MGQGFPGSIFTKLISVKRPLLHSSRLDERIIQSCNPFEFLWSIA